MMTQAETDRDNAIAQMATQESTVGEISARLATARASLSALDEDVVAASAAVEQWDQNLRRAQSQVEIQTSRVDAAEADVERQKTALRSAADRARDAEDALRDLQGSSDQAPDTVAEALEKALADAQDELTRAESTETETRNALHATEREREALAATVSALELALRSESDGSEVSSLPGVTGSVSDSLRVTTGYETAIARALGSLADAHLVASKKDALGVVSARTNSQGRMELVIAEGEKVSATDIAGLTSALEVVKGPAGVLALLAQTFIAEDIAAVESAWSTVPEGMTVVTKDGDVFSDQVVRTGSGEAQSRLELAAQRDSTKTALDALSTELERLAFDAEQAKAKRVAAAEAVTMALGELRTADASRAEFGEQVSRARASLDAAQQEITRLEQALAESEAALATASIEDHRVSIQALEDFQKTERPGVDETERLEARALVDTIAAEEVEARIALEAARQRASSLGEQVEALAARVKQEEVAREREQARHLERVRKAKLAAKVLSLLPAVMDVASASVEESGNALVQAEAARQASHQELLALRESESSVRERLATITDSVHSLEMQVYEKKLPAHHVARARHGRAGSR